ncbi:hypothetical protein GCM10011579_024520 [Streptomyces albiflavescens]|uniref:Uncharacterized protein n=1 Tax=Streptomyces albiflavescens TaxID=1623582 RepID=A0A917XZS0_9ACTN|nr:hypothetical protein GCM10011579_024520 [Streptomyces albiflavescens]
MPRTLGLPEPCAPPRLCDSPSGPNRRPKKSAGHRDGRIAPHPQTTAAFPLGITARCAGQDRACDNVEEVIGAWRERALIAEPRERLYQREQIVAINVGPRHARGLGTEFPMDKTIKAGRCAAGLIAFPVPGSRRPERVVYGPDGLDPVEWAVPKA